MPNVANICERGLKICFLKKWSKGHQSIVVAEYITSGAPDYILYQIPDTFVIFFSCLLDYMSMYAHMPVSMTDIWKKKFFMFSESIFITISRCLVNFSHYIGSLPA